MDPIAATMRAVYDRGASSYAAATDDIGLFPGFEDELARFSRRLASGGSLLDLGCGTGRDVDWFAAQGFRVVAGDLSYRMLELVAGRTGEALGVQLEMTELPFGGSSFAGAWVCASMVHLPGCLLGQALHELYRVLCPGGAVAISMKEGRGEGWSAGKQLTEKRWFTHVCRDEFAGLLRAAGFAEVGTHPCPRPPWFVAEAVKPARGNSRSPDRSSAVSA
ncbi:class I SAM-dependent DNA methyltransferase [Amycolatopsis samaneae]|uniref:Class I SAM-dependent DNA methyltransferase n=1 Tax=Amycolatopsis samaneae TaxID=664691 RepID=A0ABW5GAT7_9PSEU